MSRTAPTIAPELQSGPALGRSESQADSLHCSSRLEEYNGGQTRTNYDLALSNAVEAQPSKTEDAPDGLAAAPEIAPETARFLNDLFSQRPGELCLGYIDGDPQIEDMRSEWYSWPRQRAAVLERFAWHDAQGHDIYVRLTLFKKSSGTKVNALPSPWIWRDDVKETRAAYTMLVETSEGNYQALIQLDRDASTDERKRLMTAWRDKHADSDDCSSDPVHFVRVPGGHNHKRHGCWPVRLVEQTARIYNADALLAKCSGRQARGGETHTPPDSGALALDQKALAYWLTHVEQLLNTDKTLPRAFVRDTPGRRILELRAAGKGMLFHTSGSWDASRERLWLANSLVLARYTNEQIAALLWHFEVTETIEIKGKDAIWSDIGRVIGMARQAHPTITPKLYGAQPKKVKRGRAGSHADLVERVYQILLDHRAGDKAIVKTSELAGVIGCHRRTIISILDELKAAGRIGERKQLGQHGGLIIPISGVIYSAQAEAVSPQPVAPNDPPPAATPGETGSLGGCVSPDRARDDHSSLAEPPTPAALVAEYLDHYTEEPRRKVRKRTTDTGARGEVTYTEYVHTADRFVAFVAACLPGHPWSGTELRAAYKAVRKARGAEYWQAERAKLRAMQEPKELYRAIESRRKGLDRNIGRRLEGRWRWRLQIAEEERQRRGLPVEPPNARKRKPGGPAQAALFGGAD